LEFLNIFNEKMDTEVDGVQGSSVRRRRERREGGGGGR
jgi:hypothetical protein